MIPPSKILDFELGYLERLSMHREIQIAKRSLVKLGFTHQLALYGVIHDDETDKDRYTRIDVLLDAPLTHEIFIRIYDFMALLKPPTKYSIWAYSDETKEIVEVKYFG